MVRGGLPSGLLSALHSGDLEKAFRRVARLSAEQPFARPDACRVFARAAHMRLLGKRLDLADLQAFLWTFSLCADDRAAVQVVEASADGRPLKPWEVSGVLHLIEQAPHFPASSSWRDRSPLGTVACGRTLPVRRAHATAWGCAESSRLCRDCLAVAGQFSEAWVGKPKRSMIPPALALPVREAVIAAVAAKLPEVLALPFKEARAELAQAAERELWQALAEQAARSFIGRRGQLLPARARLRISDARLRDKLGVDVLGASAPFDRIGPQDWRQVFLSSTNPHRQEMALLELMVPAFAVSDLPVAVAA